MNTNRPQAQKLDSVGTFYVMLLFVLAAIAVGTVIAIEVVLPAVNDFTDTLTQTSAPHKSR